MSDTNYITFIDNAGRTIFGEVAEENDISIAVKNPVMIMVNQQQNGQMAVQLFPLFFQELLTLLYYLQLIIIILMLVVLKNLKLLNYLMMNKKLF